MNTVESNRLRGILKTRWIDGAKEMTQLMLPELNKALIDKIYWRKMVRRATIDLPIH